MATKTQSILVGSEWMQLTDGTQSVIIQALSSIRFVVADAKPSDGAIGHSATGFVVITPPTQMWCRAPRNSEGVYVIVTPND